MRAKNWRLAYDGGRSLKRAHVLNPMPRLARLAAPLVVRSLLYLLSYEFISDDSEALRGHHALLLNALCNF